MAVILRSKAIRAKCISRKVRNSQFYNLWQSAQQNSVVIFTFRPSQHI